MKVLLALAACACVLYPAHADAQPPLPTCTQLNGSSFSGTGAVRTLKTDCRTSVTITVPANMTLNGNGNTIVAFDPVGGFNGGVIRNETAGAVNVRVAPGSKISPAITALPSEVTLIQVVSRTSISMVSACVLAGVTGTGSGSGAVGVTEGSAIGAGGTDCGRACGATGGGSGVSSVRLGSRVTM